MPGPTLSRRSFLKLVAASAVGTTLAGVGGYAYAHDVEPGRFEVTYLPLTLPRLHPAFDGFRLAQISDIHMDAAFMTEARFAQVVRLVNREHADLIVITGDYVTFAPDYFAPGLVRTLRQLAAPEGVLGVLGNHDHWTHAPTVRGILDEAGITNVCNDVFTLRRGDGLLHIAGIDDYWERQDRLDVVLDRLPGDGAGILLAHEPDYADISAATGRFDLELSGHSHGGQVSLPLIGPVVLPTYGQKYPAGRYQVGTMIQYTNRGIGMVAPQVRFNCRPEITVFTLRAPR